MTLETASPANPAAPLLDHVDTAMEILREERLALMRGAYEGIAAIAERKAAILERLESSVGTVPGTGEAVGALRRLIADSRRNERILAAAREGLAQARRRIATIARTSRGVVAYQEDGSMIACRPDRSDTDKSA